jgi:cytochrome P450
MVESSPRPRIQISMNHSFRSALATAIGRPEFDVRMSRELPIALRSERWSILCDFVESWDGLSSERRVRACWTLAKLGLFDEMLMLPPELGGTAALSLGEAIYNVIDSLAAGYGTIGKMITNAVATLFEHRDEYDRISADPALLDRAVEELLRFATSVQGIFRVTTRPVALGGVTLPAGARVFLSYASANHDEQRFEHPDVLDIDRPLTRDHMTFGRGIHSCTGSSLARLTIRIALESLQKRLPNLRPATNAAPRRTRHFFLSGYDILPVEWDQN